jgi:hypothetical protein
MAREKNTVVEDALEEIYDQHGELVPEDVVTAATPRNHPLHNRFEWDDTVAGHEYRIMQARQLIMSVQIRFVSPEGQEHKVRAYASKFQAGKVPPGYHRIDQDFDSELDRAYLLRSMEREWKSLQQRWAYMAEFWQLISESMPPVKPPARKRSAKKAS